MKRIMFAAGVLPEPFRRLRDLTAIVPIIPANLRPAKALHRYVILWEADWEAVPVDPMLLRHLHGDLYVVLAVWDLTPVERAVLNGRL